jgi:Shwachman-Bodian-Diamond syndrome (SBDS) protein
MDSASKSTLENEFGTSNDEAVIAQILEKGAMQESEVSDHRRPNELFTRLTGCRIRNVRAQRTIPWAGWWLID